MFATFWEDFHDEMYLLELVMAGRVPESRPKKFVYIVDFT